MVNTLRCAGPSFGLSLPRWPICDTAQGVPKIQVLDAERDDSTGALLDDRPVVDVHYTAAVADAVTVVNQDFDASPDGVIDPASGRVHDLGEATFELSPGSMQFGRFGAEDVAWDLVDLGTPIGGDQIAGTRIDMTIHHQPSTIGDHGEVTSLPASAGWVHEWQSFCVEIWVSTPETTTVGITEAMADLRCDTEYLTAQAIQYGPGFQVDVTGQIDDALGRVHQILPPTEFPGIPGVSPGNGASASVRNLLFSTSPQRIAPLEEHEPRSVGDVDRMHRWAGRWEPPDDILTLLADQPSDALLGDLLNPRDALFAHTGRV